MKKIRPLLNWLSLRIFGRTLSSKGKSYYAGPDRNAWALRSFDERNRR